MDNLKIYPLELKEIYGYSRDSKWRPLITEEATIQPNSPQNLYGYAKSAATEEAIYYWLKDKE